MIHSIPLVCLHFSIGRLTLWGIGFKLSLFCFIFKMTLFSNTLAYRSCLILSSTDEAFTA